MLVDFTGLLESRLRGCKMHYQVDHLLYNSQNIVNNLVQQYLWCSDENFIVASKYCYNHERIQFIYIFNKLYFIIRLRSQKYRMNPVVFQTNIRLSIIIIKNDEFASLLGSTVRIGQM